MTRSRRQTMINETRTQTQQAPLADFNPHTPSNSTSSVFGNDFNADFPLQSDHEEAWRNRDRPQMADEEFVG